MRPRGVESALIPFLALLLLSCSGPEDSEKPGPAPLGPTDLPTIEDVLGPAYSDGSCACEMNGMCANIADAIPGYWEGRNLQCRVEDAAGRIAKCRFESRYWDATFPEKPVPSPWESRESLYHHYGGGWCEGRPEAAMRP
jgi:hypothetical protein